MACAALGIADEVLSSSDAMEISNGPIFLPWVRPSSLACDCELIQQCVTIVLLDCSISGAICLGLYRFRTGTLHGNRLLKKLIMWVGAHTRIYLYVRLTQCKVSLPKRSSSRHSCEFSRSTKRHPLTGQELFGLSPNASRSPTTRPSILSSSPLCKLSAAPAEQCLC